LRIGTWNVLSLYRPGASNILKQEGGGKGADGPGGIAGDKMVRKWYLGEEKLCNFFIVAIL